MDDGTATGGIPGPSRDAIVIGGGLAGMLAVTALLGHVDTVTVVERDRYPAEHVFRKGVPQARHLHLFLSGGQRALDDLLPGTVRAFTEAGARRMHLPRDIITRSPSGWQRRFDERRHTCLSATRPLLDGVVRTRALAAAARSSTRVAVLEATEAIGLTGDAHRVTGVRVRPRPGEGTGRPAERELSAGLVVDASGRGSRTPQWLAELGRRAPREETVDAGIAYATQVFRPLAPDAVPDLGVNVPATPDCPRGAALLPVEDGQVLLTLAGPRGHHPPTDTDGFREYTTTLADLYVRRLLDGLRPVSPVHGFRDTGNRRRHFERPGAAPEGLIVLGDATCTFNPVYGQGMSVAALGARALRETLRASGGLAPGVCARAQRAVSRTADPAWVSAVGADRRYALGDDAKASLAERLNTWYVDRLAARAAVDATVGAAFRDVFCLTAPPVRLLRPRVVLRTVLLPQARALPAPPTAIEPLPGTRARAAA